MGIENLAKVIQHGLRRGIPKRELNNYTRGIVVKKEIIDDFTKQTGVLRGVERICGNDNL
jgi:hypothetical protein